MEETILAKSQRLLKVGSAKDIQDFLPELVSAYEKLDMEVAQTELEYDLFKINRYEYYKWRKTRGEIKWSDKEIEMESKKDALKRYGDMLLNRKVVNHYKLNIEMLSQRNIDIAVENKNMREAGL